jgi:hypothetical protein
VSALLAVLLAGCGGSDTDTVRSAVGHFQSAIQTYNDSNPTTLQDTANACQKAYDDLSGDSALLNTTLSGKLKREQKVLRRAYVAARNGFHGCATGARSMNYPQTAEGQQQISDANAAIAQARRMEH